MLKINDAHLHLNMKSDNPVSDFLSFFEKNGIDKCVLILNEKDEMNCLFDNFSMLENYLDRIHFALLLNPNDSTDFDNYKKLFDEKGIEVSIKLHPRISDIKEEDFDKVLALLNGYEYKNIIVDGIFYGACVRNFIAIELVIYLAERLKDKRIILAHFGGHKVLEAMLYTRQLENVYYDISCSVCYFRGTSVMMDLAHSIRHSKNRVMLGSDYPMFDTLKSYEALRELCNTYNIPEDVTDLVAYKNTGKIYFNE